MARALAKGGSGSSRSKFRTDTTAPSTPEGLSATSVSSTSITVSWGASTDNVGVKLYRLYRCSGSGCSPDQQIANSAETSYTDSGLIANTVYSYQVVAVDAAGNASAPSSIAATKTLGALDTPIARHDGAFCAGRGKRGGHFVVFDHGELDCIDRRRWRDRLPSVSVQRQRLHTGCGNCHRDRDKLHGQRTERGHGLFVSRGGSGCRRQRLCTLLNHNSQNTRSRCTQYVRRVQLSDGARTRIRISLPTGCTTELHRGSTCRGAVKECESHRRTTRSRICKLEFATTSPSQQSTLLATRVLSLPRYPKPSSS